MTKKIAVIDYKVGNIRSVIEAFSIFDLDISYTSCYNNIMRSDAIVLPGVGSYSYGANNLKKLGLDDTIKEYAEKSKPIMGICLGMQLLMNESEEFGNTKGLGLIDGKVKSLSNYTKHSVPHIGWEEVMFKNNFFQRDDFFFCHSYIAILENQQNMLATAKCKDYTFCAAARKDNIIGLQFHPEKSSKSGIKLIEKFIDMIKDS